MENKKRRLVIVQPALGRYRKGFIESLVLINDTFDISVFCSPIDNAGVKSMETVDKSIDYRKVRLTSIFGIFFWQHLFFKSIVLNLKKGDALVVNGNPRFLSGLIISLIVKLRGADIYWWGHAWSSTSSKLGSFIRFKIMNLYKVILYTEEEIELTKELIKSPVIALNNGLDIKSIRKNLQIDNSRYDEKVLELVFLGRFTRKSNFELLIEALLSIPESDIKSIKLKIIGNISAEEIIMKFPNAKYLNLEFFGEIWDEDEISMVLKNSHVFVYPGAVGLSLIHAFAVGLPAILHDNRFAHMPEIGAFKDNENGISFKYESVLSLSESILFCKNNRHTVRQLSINAYNTVSNNFNTYDMAARFLGFIKEEQ